MCSLSLPKHESKSCEYDMLQHMKAIYF
uniref:Uncharacterized protein n=1 Tax=Arundo donax TaxID=35708 RepID=A0A0A9B691_ARUDO